MVNKNLIYKPFTSYGIFGATIHRYKDRIDLEMVRPCSIYAPNRSVCYVPFVYERVPVNIIFYKND